MPSFRVGRRFRLYVVLVSMLTPALMPEAAAAQEVRRAAAGTLSLNVDEAHFVRLDRPAKTVFLSNPGIADIDLQSARNLYVVGRTVGESSLFVLDENDDEIMSTTVAVRADTARLGAAARRAARGGSVTVAMVGGAIFLGGVAPTAEDGKAVEDVVTRLAGPEAIVVNRMEIARLPQISLQVRIAEVSRSVSEDLGIRLWGSGGGGMRGFNAPPTGLDSPFTISLRSKSGSINLVLDALARNGLVTILSEPNLTTRSGEKATFLAGGRVPYIYGSSDNESLQLEPIGVELAFTPTVLHGGRIQIALETQVRDIDTANSFNDRAPALTERSAATTVELRSGQSFAIAGMLRSDTKQALSGFPGLAKLPVLGALFRSTRYAKGETELVIIVTPYLVSPSAKVPGTPVDQIEPVHSGAEQFVHGRMTRVGQRAGSGNGARNRAGGFMLQ